MTNQILFRISVTLLVWSLCSCVSHVPTQELNDHGTALHHKRDGGNDTDCSYFYFLWGKTAESEKKYDEAIEAYEKAVVCDPYAELVIRRLASLLIRQNRQQQALAWIEKLVEQKPDDLQVKMILARLYASAGEIEAAVKMCQDILKMVPDNTEARLMLGSLYMNSHAYEKARSTIELAMEKDPESAAAYQYAARLYRELGLYGQAFSAYEKSLELRWFLPLALEAALLYEEQKRLDDAAVIYQKILAQDEANENAAGRLVWIYSEQGLYEEALSVLTELRKYVLDTQKVDFSTGRLLMQQEKYDEAIEFFSEMLEVYPDFDVAYSVIALAYYEKGEVAKAKKLLLDVTPSSSGYEEAFTLLIKIMGESKEYDGAINLIDKVIEEGNFPATEDLYPILATLYQEKGDLEGAHSVYEKALVLYPDEPDLQFEYGMFLDRLGEQDKAIAAVQEVLETDPDNPFALNYLGYTWTERNENLTQALEFIERALVLRPHDGFIQDSLGWVLYKIGRIENAIEALEKAVKIESDDPTILEHLGDVYFHGKQPDKAEEFYQKALEYQDEQDDITRLKKKLNELK